MKLFAGLGTSDYQDVLRAIGALLDDQRYRDVRIWEHEDGLILQGRQEDGGSISGYQTFLLSDDDLREMLGEAYQRRGMPGRRLMQGA